MTPSFIVGKNRRVEAIAEATNRPIVTITFEGDA